MHGREGVVGVQAACSGAVGTGQGCALGSFEAFVNLARTEVAVDLLQHPAIRVTPMDCRDVPEKIKHKHTKPP